MEEEVLNVGDEVLIFKYIREWGINQDYEHYIRGHIVKRKMSDDLDGIKNLWIILNSILVLYAIILLIYGKYFRNKDSLSIVTHNFLIIFI